MQKNWDEKDRYVLLDGAMGTVLQEAGLPLGGRPELLNLTQPDLIEGVHRRYIEAGAQVIYTNTFGANRKKLAGCGHGVEEVVAAAVGCARRAADGSGCRVALDIGPIGELLEPSGSLPFEEAVDLFRQQVRAGAAAGADLVVVETMTDLLEAKAAVLAAKEVCDLPVWVSMTFEKGGHTFTGVSIPAMALTLEGLGVQALGINCSLSPRDIYPLAKELAGWTDLPLIVKANAGLPNLEAGRYDVSPGQYAADLAPFLELGVTLLGGCCGTTPEYIRQIAALVEGKTPPRRTAARVSAVCSPSRVVAVDRPRVIGERINPTGKKRFKAALAEGNWDYILAQGISQARAGADILDVNVGMPGIDEPAAMEQVVKRLQAILDLPLQIDTTDPAALERGLRVYCGKPLVNSVNGEKASLDRVLPLCKKYGAAVVGLTLDEAGIPRRAEERLAVAERIVEAALARGLPREDIYIDCLVLTASAQQDGVMETLKAVSLVKEKLGVKTVLGVSNISFGLPARELVNRTFLAMALQRGLDLPILNPNAAAMMDTVRAYRVLANLDAGAAAFIAAYGGKRETAPQASAPAAENAEEAVAEAIRGGLGERARACTLTLLETHPPLEIVNRFLIPALDRVGEEFERGTLFLPQLIQSAEAAGRAFDAVKGAIAAAGSDQGDGGRIVLATVKGDIHDIGKNIVKVILENYGFSVIDLGRDVPVEEVVRAAREHRVKLVGLSALMTTTLGSMEATIAALKAALPECRVMVGGAVLTPEYAQKIGADYYARDAKQSADIAKKLFSEEERG